MSFEPNEELALKPLPPGKELTPAHVALLKLIAQEVVEDYLKVQYDCRDLCEKVSGY
jgi:hypothetical protein